MSVFTNRAPAEKTKEQKKLSNLAWRPSKIRIALQQSGPVVAVVKREETK